MKNEEEEVKKLATSTVTENENWKVQLSQIESTDHGERDGNPFEEI